MENKKKILESLYLMRCIMSAISIEYDKYISYEIKNESYENERISCNSKLNSINKILTDRELSIKELKTELNQKKNLMYIAMEDYNERVQKKEEYTTKYKVGKITCIIGVGIFCSAIPMCVVCCNSIGASSILIGILMIIIGSVLSIIGSNLRDNHKPSYINVNESQQTYKSYEFQINSLNKHLEIQKNQLKEEHDELLNINEYIKNIDSKIEVNNKEFKNFKKQSLPLCNAYYTAMKEQFHDTGFLDIRDWAYIDLIIFFLETNRGDTIKEALLTYVDKEKRIDRIEESIAYATSSIAATIKSSIFSLQNSIDSNFRALSNTITESSNRLINSMEKLDINLNENINKFNDRFKDISNSIETCAALEQQISVCSNKLAENSEFMMNEYKKFK